MRNFLGKKSYINYYKIQNHLFFGQFSLSIDIYVQTYFNIYFVLALASFADTPCYPLNLFQGLFGFFAGCPTQSYVKNKDIYFRETKLQQFRGSKSILNTHFSANYP